MSVPKTQPLLYRTEIFYFLNQRAANMYIPKTQHWLYKTEIFSL
jgi:hypothetical protein